MNRSFATFTCFFETMTLDFGIAVIPLHSGIFDVDTSFATWVLVLHFSSYKFTHHSYQASGCEPVSSSECIPEILRIQCDFYHLEYAEHVKPSGFGGMYRGKRRFAIRDGLVWLALHVVWPKTNHQRQDLMVPVQFNLPHYWNQRWDAVLRG